MPLFPALRSTHHRPLVLLGAALVALMLAGCSQPPPPAPPPVSVQLLEVRPRAASVTDEFVGETEAFNTAEIRPRVGGLLEKQGAVEGSRVKKGQVLFIIDSQPYVAAVANAKAALAQAQAALDQAERDLGRVEPLVKLNAVSQQEYDAVLARNSAGKAGVDAARAGLRTAELNLEYTTVTSPIDGIVARAQFRVGGLVTAYSSLLTTVYDTDPMYVNFSISEQRMLEIQHDRAAGNDPTAGTVFKLVLADGSIYPHPATMNLIDAAVDATTGTLPVRLLVPNPEGTLRSGQFARVVAASRPRQDALLVPQRAVQELQGKTYVWVVDAEGKAQTRDLRMGPRIGSDWLVEEGLKPGEKIVVDGFQKVRPGAIVTSAVPAAPAPAKKG